jgi:nucleotide-binding universal stress UspA family protein
MAYRILVPLDGSDLADEVIPWVDELAPPLQADVELIRVLDLDVTSEAALGEVAFNERLATGAASQAGPIAADALESDPREPDARADLTRARNRLKRAQTVELSVIDGSPAEAIVARAAGSGATLIAMASHGRTGVARTVLGSVAGDVLRQSPVPVLVIRRGLQTLPRAPRTVLVPLDMSDLAEAALLAIEPLARELQWQIVLVHALELPPPTLPVQGAAIPLGLPPSHSAEEAATYLDEMAARLKDAGLSATTRLGSGNAADALAAEATESGADLIAMSTHGRSGLGRWVLGSVTEAAINRAAVPVLVVGPHQLKIPG